MITSLFAVSQPSTSREGSASAMPSSCACFSALEYVPPRLIASRIELLVELKMPRRPRISQPTRSRWPMLTTGSAPQTVALYGETKAVASGGAGQFTERQDERGLVGQHDAHAPADGRAHAAQARLAGLQVDGRGVEQEIRLPPRRPRRAQRLIGLTAGEAERRPCPPCLWASRACGDSPPGFTTPPDESAAAVRTSSSPYFSASSPAFSTINCRNAFPTLPTPMSATAHLFHQRNSLHKGTKTQRQEARGTTCLVSLCWISTVAWQGQAGGR